MNGKHLAIIIMAIILVAIIVSVFVQTVIPNRTYANSISSNNLSTSYSLLTVSQAESVLGGNWTLLTQPTLLLSNASIISMINEGLTSTGMASHDEQLFVFLTHYRNITQENNSYNDITANSLPNYVKVQNEYNGTLGNVRYLVFNASFSGDQPYYVENQTVITAIDGYYIFSIDTSGNATLGSSNFTLKPSQVKQLIAYQISNINKT